MSLLKSFSFGSFCGVDEIPEDVLGLFSDAVEKGTQIRYPSEIVFAGIKGSIDTTRKFNLSAYEYAIENNSNMSKNRRKKKEVFIECGVQGDDYSDILSQGGIPEDKICLESVKDEFEELVDSYELKSAIAEIKKLNREFIVVEQVDLIEALKLSLKGLPKAIEEVKRMCDFYPRIEKCLKVILSSGEDFEELLMGV